jgi:hypothetical protein
MAMNNTTRTSGNDPQIVLRNFFSIDNKFLNPISSEETVGEILPNTLVASIKRYAKGVLDRPILLPFKSKLDDSVCWFACAHDEVSSRELNDEMNAFIGPSFADFETAGAILTAKQDQVKSELNRGGLKVTAFIATSPKYYERILKSWDQYWCLLDIRPPRPRQELRTFSQLRAAFDRSLLAKCEAEALTVMTVLRDLHGLSAENRAFLEIRFDAAFGRWNQILSHPQWEDILKVPLPPETYGDIWDALYETYLTPFEINGNAVGLISTFDQQVGVTASSLLRSRGRSTRPSSIKAFLLHELTLKQPSFELCSKLLNELTSTAFGNSHFAITSLVEALQPNRGLENAIKEMELERYEQAYSILKEVPDSIDVLQAQLRCAKEMGSPLQAAESIARLESVTVEIAELLKTNRARLISDVKKLADSVVPDSIDEQRKTISSPEILDDVVSFWRELIQSKDIDKKLNQPSFVDSILNSIEESALESSYLFESLLPIWFDWLVIKSKPSSKLIKIYLGFIEALHVRDRPGESEREMIRLATRHALIAGLNSEEYSKLVNRLSDILSDSPSPREIIWSLEMADQFAVEPCRSEEARLRWITRAINFGCQFQERLSFSEKSLVRLLSQEFNLETPNFQIEETNADEAEHLNDISARILLYSLDELAIQRAARVIRSVLPNSKVDCNSDQTCTTRLKSGTGHADWVVFVSSVATHQAFFCIKSSLRKDSELLQVEGTGTTRIVEKVIRHSQTSVLMN